MFWAQQRALDRANGGASEMVRLAPPGGAVCVHVNKTNKKCRESSRFYGEAARREFFCSYLEMSRIKNEAPPEALSVQRASSHEG